MEDSEIIARVLDGNADAFGELVERYQRQLYYFVVGKVADGAEVKDIVQKSFVSAYQNLRGFAPEASFFAWLRGIALNHCRNEWRRQHRQATMKQRLLEAKRAELEIVCLEVRRDGDDRVAALRECLQQLGPDEQNLVGLRFVQELSMQAIGRELSKGGEAVRLWLYRVRVGLAECVRRRISFHKSGSSAFSVESGWEMIKGRDEC